MKLHEIREARAAKVNEARALLGTENLNAEGKARFDALKAEIVSLEQDEARAQFIEDAERRAIGHQVDRCAAALESRVSLSRVLQAQMEGRSLSGAELEYTQEAERRTGRKAQGAFVPLSLLERRDDPVPPVNTTTTAGELVPTIHRPDLYVGPLREALMARRLGVRVLTGLTGNLSIPKYGSGLSTGWVAEGGAVPDAEMGFDQVELKPSHVGGKAEMSRQLIQQSSPAIERLIRDDLAFLIAKQIDAAIIAGTGLSNQPTGVLHFSDAQTGTLEEVNWRKVLDFAQKLEDEELFGGAWLTTGTGKTILASTLKEAGLPGYLLENGSMAGRPLHVTRALTAGQDGEPVIFGDFSQILLGVWSELDVLVNPYAEPAYSRGGVVVRAMATVGVACRHEEAFVIADDLSEPTVIVGGEDIE